MSTDIERQAIDTLARAVRRICADKRLTQLDVARRGRLRRELVGRIARGQANPSLTVIAKLACGLGVTWRELIDALETAEADSKAKASEPSSASTAGPRSTQENR